MPIHEMNFTTLELVLIRDALDILSPDGEEERKRLNRLREEVREELYQESE